MCLTTELLALGVFVTLLRHAEAFVSESCKSLDMLEEDKSLCMGKVHWTQQQTERYRVLLFAPSLPQRVSIAIPLTLPFAAQYSPWFPLQAVKF